jgi:serine/threonine protein kinase
MAITDKFVLPQDLVIAPIASLPAQVREQLDTQEGDYAITRPRSRTPSSILAADTAELLESFRTPTTVVEAIIHYSEAHNSDPSETLAEAFPIIEQFINSNLLVEADSEEAAWITQTLEIGETIIGCKVIGCVQVLEDTELYYVSTSSGQEAALKLARLGHASNVQRQFDREASVLNYLDGLVNPRLLDAGLVDDCPYLLIEWCPGVNIAAAARGLRSEPEAIARPRLVKLCSRVLAAYAHLHAQGVIHSDVHPRNVLVSSDNEVKIIDYGLARIEDRSSPFRKAHRGGVHHFFEPEYIKARNTKEKIPQSSALGEQYSVAALLYQLITGDNYLDFAAEKEEAYRQIQEDEPLPFSRRGVSPWPEVEQALVRGLSKQPANRFPSIAAFAEVFDAIDIPTTPSLATNIDESLAQTNRSMSDGLFKRVIGTVDQTSQLFNSGITIAPTCSVTYGAAGLAYALYRFATIQDDAALLSLADLWITKAINNADNFAGFYNAEIEITPETVGRISPYHTASGMYWVQALISNAMGDIVTQSTAIESFISSSQAPCDSLDITLGRSGSLLACSHILETIPDDLTAYRDSLAGFGESLINGIRQEVDQFAPIQECRELSHLGIAHGWAGLLYSMLQWYAASGTTIPDAIEERLLQLAACAEQSGRGTRWKCQVRRRGRGSARSDYMTSWCNGSPGFVFLWTQAHRMLGQSQYLQLAESAAWDAFENTERIDSLCCGLAGSAYSLLNLYNYTGEMSWLSRAHTLANRSTGASTYARSKESLYKGELGVAVLMADLAKPEAARMPLFEPEGWPKAYLVSKK